MTGKGLGLTRTVAGRRGRRRRSHSRNLPGNHTGGRGDAEFLRVIPVFGPKSRNWLDFLAKNQAKLDLDPLLSTQFLRQEFNAINFLNPQRGFKKILNPQRGRISRVVGVFHPRVSLIFIIIVFE